MNNAAIPFKYQLFRKISSQYLILTNVVVFRIYNFYDHCNEKYLHITVFIFLKIF